MSTYYIAAIQAPKGGTLYVNEDVHDLYRAPMVGGRRDNAKRYTSPEAARSDARFHVDTFSSPGEIVIIKVTEEEV